MRVLKSAIIFLSFLVFFLQEAKAKDSITWLEMSFAPYWILEGPNAGEGQYSELTELLAESLDEYTQYKEAGNLSRYHQLLATGEQVCGTGIYKTAEREKIAYFSDPLLVGPQTFLVMKKSTFQKLGLSEKVSLKDVLKNKEMLLGLATNRSYGAMLDEIIVDYKSHGAILSYDYGSREGGFFEMLLYGRVDALLAHPEEFAYQGARLGALDELVTVAIEEDDTPYAYVACSKTSWGKEVIGRINEVIQSERGSLRYKQVIEKWIGPKFLPEYRKVYRTKNIGMTQ